MPAYKSHHYVPQMYMRLFSPDGMRVGVFVVRSHKLIPRAPINGQACRDYFYGRDPRTDQAFGKIEGEAARLFAAAVDSNGLPTPGSVDHEQLIFFLGIQHSRTMKAAEQHNEGSVKALKAMLRRQAELEGNEIILENLDKVRITRTNAVSEVVSYATIGANLLVDLTYVLIENASEIPFVASDAPVVFHNRLYEGQRIAVTGYANVGLQVFLPLGPRLALFGYDAASYRVRRDGSDTVRVEHDDDIRLINDLQWESAHAVILMAPNTSEHEIRARAEYWTSRRKEERVVFSEEVVESSNTQVRTRQGGGEAPSAVKLDLTFVDVLAPAPPPLKAWQIPPIRDPERVARTNSAFARMDEWNEQRRRNG